jgi:hypothetical protein
MLKLTSEEGRSIELTDADFATLDNALTGIIAECTQAAANAQISWDRDAFTESAASYRKLRDRLREL